jgi:reactive intermediate/imine deaminase
VTTTDPPNAKPTPAPPPYSPVVRAGDWVIISGQIGLRDGELVAGGIQAEFRQAIENMRTLLLGQGASLADVRKTTVFLRHMRDYSLMNETYAGLFAPPYPARSAFAVSELPFVALVEIEAWAWTGA